MQAWANFFLAEAGASAALAGLVFVGVSLNLTKILAGAALPNRALQALILLLTILIVASLMLVPGQPINAVGMETLLVGLVVWGVITYFDVRSIRTTETQFRRVITFNMVLDQATTLPYVIAGLAVLAQGESGLYWLAPAMLFSFIKAIMDAWVLLVEINR